MRKSTVVVVAVLIVTLVLLIIARRGTAEFDPVNVVLPDNVGTHGTIEFDTEVGVDGFSKVEHPWSIHVEKRDVGEYEGKIELLGVDALKAGTVYAKVSWPYVDGSIVDDSGAELATFDGTVSWSGKIEGEFSTTDGAKGVWRSNWP